MSHLAGDDIQAARDWAATRDGCTCRTTFVGKRCVVERHVCQHCRAWSKKLAETGVSDTPKPVETKKPARRKYRRAA